jgi:poly(A) RNA polymerase GLD2
VDWRLRPLAQIVKAWAQHNNINDARNMTISSYSLVLMVIHFLQCAVSPPILPCLHKIYPDKFQIYHDICNINMVEELEPIQSENKQTLGELFVEFLKYFSHFE